MEWHPTKNRLKPTEITYGSSKQVWWLCSECGHEWHTGINQRSIRGYGCLICSKKGTRERAINSARAQNFVTPGNCLEINFPEIAEEWHPTKNGNWVPSNATIGSGQKAWWLCSKCGNEWKTRISNRTAGRGCPKCTSRHFSVKKSESLQALFPDLVENFWYSRKNKGMIPNQMFPYSGKKVWWKCQKCKNRWQASVQSCTINKKGGVCPACSGRVSIVTNSIAVTHPKIIEEWLQSKNGALKPKDVTKHSSRKVWWKCKNVVMSGK